MSDKICHLCGKKIEGKVYRGSIKGVIMPLCEECWERSQLTGIDESDVYSGIIHIYPELIASHSPLSVISMRTAGFREAVLPIITHVTKEGEVKEEAPVKVEEINWDMLVGDEPSEELKKKGLAHVIAAKFAEDEGITTAKSLAKYLWEMAQVPELERYLHKFKNINEDAAREILNELANMGIVKKEKKGKTNIYDYFSGEKSWRRSGF
jgi:hypothetical protein